jgi:adenine-specific DNA-methyltransferase
VLISQFCGSLRAANPFLRIERRREPYEKRKRALRAEIDEAAWSALYSTKSRPFEKPASGKIAVKVINHYGDEVLKVYEVK